MKIGVLGTGDVGKVLSAGFSARGHSVMIGTRDPAEGNLSNWLSETGKDVKIGTFSDAAKFGDVLVFSVGWSNVDNVINLAQAKNFSGKLVIDTTNPLRFDKQGEPPVLAVGHTDSAGESIQRRLPDAYIVKAMNIVGNQHMVNPNFPDGKPDMFICGNNAEAKMTAKKLIQALNWPEPIDLGGIEASRYLEPLAMVWITYFFKNGFNGNHALKMLRK